MTQHTAGFLLIACLLAGTGVAHAQSAPLQEVTPENPEATTATAAQGTPRDPGQFIPRGVSLGVAVIWSEGRMVGEGTRTFVVPTVGYEGERLFFRGINGGVHLFKGNGFELDAILGARLDGWEAKDLGESGLAAVGIDRALLEDRDIGVDAGLGLSWRGKAGKLSLDAKADVSNASGGYEVALGYQASFPVARGLLVPSLGVSYWSADLSDYYYGTLPVEEARGVVRYRPGSAIVPSVGVSYLRPLPRGWLLVAGVEMRWLDSGIVDSPLVDDDSRRAPSVFLGLSRAFGAQR